MKTKFIFVLLSAFFVVNQSGYAKGASNQPKAGDSRSFKNIFSSDVSYLPYLQLGGAKYFNVNTAKGAIGSDLFIPIWQQPTNLVFTHLRIYDRTGRPFEGNAHVGYRHLVPEREHLYGVYGAFDRKRTDNGNYFNQLTFGVEAWFNTLFVGGNFYQPIGTSKRFVGITDEIVDIDPVQGNIWLTTNKQYERALGGGDAEVGYEFTKGLIAYVGGYYFSAKGVDTIIGPKARITYDWSLGGGKKIAKIFDKLGLEAGAQKDTRGAVYYVGANARIGLWPNKGADLCGVSRHMVDLVRRDVDVVTSTENDKSRELYMGPVIPLEVKGGNGGSGATLLKGVNSSSDLVKIVSPNTGKEFILNATHVDVPAPVPTKLDEGNVDNVDVNKDVDVNDAANKPEPVDPEVVKEEKSSTFDKFKGWVGLGKKDKVMADLEVKVSEVDNVSVEPISKEPVLDTAKADEPSEPAVVPEQAGVKAESNKQPAEKEVVNSEGQGKLEKSWELANDSSLQLGDAGRKIAKVIKDKVKKDESKEPAVSVEPVVDEAKADQSSEPAIVPEKSEVKSDNDEGQGKLDKGWELAHDSSLQLGDAGRGIAGFIKNKFKKNDSKEPVASEESVPVEPVVDEAKSNEPVEPAVVPEQADVKAESDKQTAEKAVVKDEGQGKLEKSWELANDSSLQLGDAGRKIAKVIKDKIKKDESQEPAVPVEPVVDEAKADEPVEPAVVPEQADVKAESDEQPAEKEVVKSEGQGKLEKSWELANDSSLQLGDAGRGAASYLKDRLKKGDSKAQVIEEENTPVEPSSDTAKADEPSEPAIVPEKSEVKSDNVVQDVSAKASQDFVEKGWDKVHAGTFQVGQPATGLAKAMKSGWHKLFGSAAKQDADVGNEPSIEQNVKDENSTDSSFDGSVYIDSLKGDGTVLSSL